jgi:hypothetical protein
VPVCVAAHRVEEVALASPDRLPGVKTKRLAAGVQVALLRAQLQLLVLFGELPDLISTVAIAADLLVSWIRGVE